MIHVTSRMLNAQFSYASFGSDVFVYINQITLFYLMLYFGMGVLLWVPPIFRKHFFLEHLCTMDSINSIEKDSIAAAQDSFKNCILACKISNQMHTNFEKKKLRKQPMVILCNGCSVRQMFCTIFVSSTVAKILEKHVRSDWS